MSYRTSNTWLQLQLHITPQFKSTSRSCQRWLPTGRSSFYTRHRGRNLCTTYTTGLVQKPTRAQTSAKKPLGFNGTVFHADPVQNEFLHKLFVKTYTHRQSPGANTRTQIFNRRPSHGETCKEQGGVRPRAAVDRQDRSMMTAGGSIWARARSGARFAIDERRSYSHAPFRGTWEIRNGNTSCGDGLSTITDTKAGGAGLS